MSGATSTGAAGAAGFTGSGAAAKSLRLPALDILRGFVIALMALDHVRDFFAPTTFALLDLTQTTPAWFWTRWITHLCAPTFVLLAGISAFLRAQKYSRAEMVRYLASRGALLVLLEITLINFSWQFGFDTLVLQVFWALGMSMIALALLINLPRLAIGLIAAALILPHNLLDALHGPQASIALRIWHQGGWFGVKDGFGVLFLYPLMPWVGLMAAGYAAGPFFLRPAPQRVRGLCLTALLLLLSFVVLRSTNLYGDPQPWQAQPAGFFWSLMSFVNVQKYPPSLLYLCITLSLSLALLAWFERQAWQDVPLISLFGRHPLFFYCVHVLLIHGLAWCMMQGLYGAQPHWSGKGQVMPSGYTASLLLCYGAWLAMLLLLYAITRKWEQMRRPARLAAV